MAHKKTFAQVDPTGEKQKAVMNYYRTRSREELVSLIMSLFYPEDIEGEYKNLPTEFKKKYPHTASNEK